MTLYCQRRTTLGAFILCCCLAMALPVKAETSSNPDRWEFGGAAYLWAAGVEGTSVAGDKVDVPFSDVLDKLDGGLMGVIAAQKGKWTLIGDFIYLSIHDETSSTANVIGVPVVVDVDVELKGFISTFGVSYRVLDDDTTSVELLAGARYIGLDVDLVADVGANVINYSDSEDSLDAVIGGQVMVDLSEKWYLSFYADVGAGDSKFTWQAWPGVGYRFESVDAVVGYRHLEWETDNGDTFDDLNFNGPMIGVKFSF